ncbi:hypothetical protein MA617_000232 [Vibrio vulnificus]|nr:hypothetical protein [Vibrio vulnificus]
MKEKDVMCLVLGGHVNGFSIIRELADLGVDNIALFDYGRSISKYSKKVSYYSKIDKKPDSLLKQIIKLKQVCKYIVIYPTDDLQLEMLNAIKDEIKEFCFIPFNSDNLTASLDKNVQYESCDACNVPYPRSLELSSKVQPGDFSTLVFPIIIKPTTRKDLTVNVFRTLYIEDFNDLNRNIDEINRFVNLGINFIASEFVPGDDTNIYAYTCFRGNDGRIYGEWTGKKLTQYPDAYGVFSSASNEAPDIILKQGRKIVDQLGAYGVVEPEFKYDVRTGEFKLMEVNLRSMMWNRIGFLSGVNLHYQMYLFAIGKDVPPYQQKKHQIVHLVLMLHEIQNLITRRGYWRYFKSNVFSKNTTFAILDFKDLSPFFVSLALLCKGMFKSCLIRLKQ